MQAIEILLVSMLVAFTQGTTSSQLYKWLTSWTEGGSNVAPEEFPYQVSLRKTKGGDHYCGGSIVSRDYIVTAAHCAFGLAPESIIAVVGASKLNSIGKRHAISRIIIHPDFDNAAAKDDIALLKVKQEMGYSPTVQNILLPLEDTSTNVGTTCVTTGWGINSLSGKSMPNDFQKLEVKIIDSSECKKHYGSFDDNNICASAAPKKGICKGDSGGPLICDRQLVGVLSGGGTWTTTCTSDKPIGYTYVSKYIKWIKRNAV